MYNVLLVDDESMVRIGVKTCVNWKGLGVEHVFEAANGQEALRIIETQDIGILITDIKMSVMDGFSLLEEMKIKKYTPIVIVMSCYNDYENMRLAMSYGVKDFLFKPKMYPQDIEQAIRKVQNQLEEQQNKNQTHTLSLMNEDNQEEKKVINEELFRALQFIDSNISNPELNQEMIAEYVGLSSSYFCRLFKNKLGLSYSSYIIKKRIELAETLYMTTNMKIAEIGKKVGYTNERYFARLYREHKGSSMKNALKKQKE